MTTCNYSYEQLSQDELKTIEARMYPGKYSNAGFLQLDEKLHDVYLDDKQFLENCGITYDQIAGRLTTIIEEYYICVNQTKNNVCVVEDKYLVSSVSYMGAQECTFQNKSLDKKYHGYEYGCTDMTISNSETGKKISFNTLLPHMIKYHHFFESPKSEHRLDPKNVIELFNLLPGVDYSPKYQDAYRWQTGSGSSLGVDKYTVMFVARIALKIYIPNEDVIGLLLPSHDCLGFFGIDECVINYLEKNTTINWADFRKCLLNKYGDSMSNEEMQNVIDEELVKIKNYQETGNLEGLTLYAVNFNQNYESIKTSIENLPLEIYPAWEGRYDYTKYKAFISVKN